MNSLNETLREAEKKRVAVGHFNFSELVILKAAAEAAASLGVPVVMGVSESERDFLGVRQAAALIRTVREETGREVFLNGDHTHSIAKAEQAARAGFDMIVFDASETPLEENIAETRRAVEAAKSIRPSILVEGEVGYVGSGSEIHEKRPENIRLTEPEESREFVARTMVDLLSPSVGTTHGMLPSMIRGTERKRLNILWRILGLDPLQGQVVQVVCTLSARHGADGDHSACEHRALEAKMERTSAISRRVDSGLSVLARVLRLPIVLVFLLFASLLQAGAQDKQALIREALSAAPPEVAKTATVKNWDGTLLKPGTGAYTCYPTPDSRKKRGNMSMCLDKTGVAWHDAWMNKKPFRANEVGIVYMLAGDVGSSNTDPYAEAQPVTTNGWSPEGTL